MERRSSFFQGTELPRLLILSILMIAGWGFIWRYTHKLPEPAEPPVAVIAKPEPLEADTSIEFETVTDRTPLGLRDNAAYALLLGRARAQTPAALAAASRRDVVLTSLWEHPQNYRAVPIHLLGTARRIIRYPSKLATDGWLYEAWIITPDTPLVPFVCVFEDAPRGLPLGADVSERVVFNGRFLKIMKYQSGDANRGAPVLIGKIGWEPRDPSPMDAFDPATTLQWSLVIIAAMFLISLIRWVFQLKRLFGGPSHRITPSASPSEVLDPNALDNWLRAVADSEPPRDHASEDHMHET